MQYAVFALILSVTLAHTWGQDIMDFKQKPCCTPMKYEIHAWATIGQKNGPIGTAKMSRVSMDLSKNMTSIVEEVYGQTMNVIVAYNQRMAYVISDDDGNERTCRKMKLPAGSSKEISNCVPQDAEYLGSMKLGGGAGSMQCDSWAIKRNFMGSEMTEVVVFQRDGCVPINEYVYVRAGEFEMEQTLGFYDFTRGIKDPTVFDIPTICDHAKELDLGDVIGGLSNSVASRFLA